MYAIKGTMEIRVEDEESANRLHKEYEEYAHNNNFTLSSWTQMYKCKKTKGEIVDEYYICRPIIIFTDVKEPDVILNSIKYNVKKFGGYNDSEDQN